MVTPPRPTRSDYLRWETVSTRWADIDVYGHMNNARYFEIIDTVVNNHLIEGTGVDIRGLPISCIQSGTVSGPDAHHELIKFLRLLLSEAKHLSNSVQVVGIQETIRCVESLDEKSCQQIFWSLCFCLFMVDVHNTHEGRCPSGMKCVNNQ